MITYWFFLVSFIFLVGYFAYDNYKLKSKLSQKQFLDKEELLIYEYDKKSKAYQVDQITKELIKIEKEKQDIEQLIINKKNELDSIDELINSRHEQLSQVRENIAIEQINCDKELEERKKENEEHYKKHLETLQECVNKVIDSYSAQELVIKDSIQTYENHIAALIEAQKRALEEENNLEYYKISLDDNELEDVNKLLNLSLTLNHPDILKKLVYKTYFEKKMNDLLSRVIGVDSEVSGVYKITHIDSKMAYVGQAVNIKERWRKHLKCGLGIDTPVTNVFYQAMMKYKPWNFTWEILEYCPKEKLNEIEKYYIDFYQTKSWGWNSKGGNSK